MSVLWSLLSLAIALILWKYRRSNSAPNSFSLPSGYEGLPLLGFLVHFLYQKDYIQRLVHMKENYGPIFTVRMGSFRCLWLCDYDVIREAWSRPEFSGRPLVPGILERTGGFRGGIIFNDGEQFAELQRFVMKSLRYLGMGKNSMESFIQMEVSEILLIIQNARGAPMSLRHAFNIAALNVVWAVASGKRYSHDDPELLRLTAILDKNMELNDGAKAAFFMPWLAKLFPTLSGWKSYIEQAQEIFTFWESVARERMRSFEDSAVDSEEPTSFVDAYIRHMKACKDESSCFHGEAGVRTLATTLQDLFIAGTETTATTLSWFFLYMASYPRVQQEVINEIGIILGFGNSGRLPCLQHRRQLPLLEASLMETMRFGTLAPLGMVHRTMVDTTFRGYYIPANTIVMSNVAAVHMSKEYWSDPEVFRPQRFLSPCGSRRVDFPYFLPFSHGKRKCMGEALARDVLFIFAATILQKYRVRLEGALKSLDPVVGVSAVPPRHRLIFEPHSIL